MKKLVVGILAHVDAGKTTLSEALLYISGNRRKLGRVDHGDAFLDTEIGNADVVEDGFVEIRELLASPELAGIQCPLCGGALTREKFAHCRGQRYDALIHCEKDGELLLRLKLFHNFNDTWRAHVRILPATEDVVSAYRERTKEHTVKKRPRRHRSRRGKGTAKPDEASPAAETPVSRSKSGLKSSERFLR